jgi:hypothetical protein
MFRRKQGYSTCGVKFTLEADQNFTIYDTGGRSGAPPAPLSAAGRIVRGRRGWTLVVGGVDIATYATVPAAKQRYLEDRGLIAPPPPPPPSPDVKLVTVNALAWHSLHRWREDVNAHLKQNPNNTMTAILRLWCPVQNQGTYLVLRLPAPIADFLVQTTTGVVIAVDRG